MLIIFVVFALIVIFALTIITSLVMSYDKYDSYCSDELRLLLFEKNYPIHTKPRVTISSVVNWVEKEYGYEIYIFPFYSKEKCGYDSYTKLGYNYQILKSEVCQPNIYGMFANSEEFMDDDWNFIPFNTKEEAYEHAIRSIIT
jgi:hypothetical protein